MRTVSWLKVFTALSAWVCYSPSSLAGGFEGSIPSVNGNVQSIAEVDEGMILVTGPFSVVNDLTIRRMARLFPDGQTDRSFQAEPDDEVLQFLPRAGGGGVALGRFNRIGGALEPFMAALLPNGSRDPAVSYGLQAVPVAGLVQPDGKLVIGGSPFSINGVSHGTLLRFLPNGPLDTSFNAKIAGAVSGVQLMTNGKLVVWGFFTIADGVTRVRLARLNADGTLDSSFSPPSMTGVAAVMQLQVVEQADGKLLMGGVFSGVAGTPAQGMVRLLASGSRDPDFSANFATGTASGIVRTIALQQDGMILAGGTFTSVNGTARNCVARLFANGALDATYDPNLNAAVQSVALQESGGILLAGDFTTASVGPRSHLYGQRVTPSQSSLSLEPGSTIKWSRSGSLAALDRVRFESYNDGSMEWADLGAATEVAGGWQLVGASLPVTGTVKARGVVRGSPGSWRTARLQVGAALPRMRLETIPGQPLPATGGSMDFDGLPAPPVSLKRHQSLSLINSGSGLLVAPTFTLSGPHAGDFTVNGSGLRDLAPGETARLSISFKPLGTGLRTAVLSITSNAPGSPHLLSLRGEGTNGLVSAVFRHPEDQPLIVETLPSGLKLGPLVIGFHPAPGTVLRLVDNRHPTAASPWFTGIQPLNFLTTVFEGISYQFQVVYTGGSTSSLGNDVLLVLAGPGTLRRRIQETTALAGLPDGRLVLNMTDLSSTRSLIFASSTGRTESAFPDINITAHSVVVRDDGKLLVVDNVPMEASLRLRLLLANGQQDPGFPPFLLPYTLNPEQMAVGPDGTVFISSQHPDGTGRGLLRLPFGATVPVPFGPSMLNNMVRGGIGALAVQPDGKVLVGCGTVSSGLEIPERFGMLRLMPNGNLDTGFAASLPLGGAAGVTRIILQPDSKILICGEFTKSPGTSLLCLQRLLPNGSLDTTFQPNLEANPGGGFQREVTSMALQADGRVVIGGDFTRVGGRARNRLARLLPDGNLDPTFAPDVNQIVQTVSLTSSGEVAIAGTFNIVNSTPTGRGALLENDPPVSSLSVLLGEGPASVIRWRRGGSLPEAEQVTFEVSYGTAEGWTRLGTATRILGVWEMARLSLMPAGRIRARARYTSGYGGGCSGLQETISSYPIEKTPQQRWREDFFNTFENSGDAADMADPDADGQPNFMEFAFGTNPLASVQTGIPHWQRSELFSSFSLDFTAKAGTENFRFSGEWLGDAQISGGWNISQNLGRQPDWTFREVIANRPNQFGRLRIVLPSSSP